MEIQATPFPGKSQPLKSKPNRKTVQAPKGNAKEPPIQRQRRVFGTTRNPNVPEKPVPAKPQTKKPSIQISPKQPKPNKSSPARTEALEKKSPEKNRAIPKKKKSVGFEEPIGKSNEVIVQEGDVGLKTPVAGSSRRVSGTPYQSAERCSKCRFDRLETSAYWLGQIKLAESVGKHFVSAAFFRLALESKAEPAQSLRSELKRYVARHERLSTEAEWRQVSVTYGLIQGEVDANHVSPLDQAQKQLMEETEI
ncbi:Titin like [Actinidia chinensis var. chinensis]|uniref:Titin like n=1 Tax=Actinidia chinensis var. chinensis TaxID=1590841 RepID=A0A2R6PQ44_ACTCC|nr:Titin like [Actinidia chinensis var. chinensis]